MAWEISMSGEGWDNVRRNVYAWPKEKLYAALCSDYAQKMYAQGDDNEEHAREYAEIITDFPHDVLASEIYDIIVSNNTADNGGAVVWVDLAGDYKVPVDLTPEGAAIALEDCY